MQQIPPTHDIPSLNFRHVVFLTEAQNCIPRLQNLLKQFFFYKINACPFPWFFFFFFVLSDKKSVKFLVRIVISPDKYMQFASEN